MILLLQMLLAFDAEQFLRVVYFLFILRSF